MICSRLLRAVCCSAFLAFAVQSFAANSVVWDESVSGDVSNDPTAPTQMNLVAGTNSFIATMPGADLDFFTVHVPAGTVLSAIYNPVYDSADQVSFIAIGPGTSMPAAVLNYDPTGLLGYTHFGPGVYDLGENLLTDLGHCPIRRARFHSTVAVRVLIRFGCSRKVRLPRVTSLISRWMPCRSRRAPHCF